MTHSLLSSALRRALCALALVLLVGPVSAQDPLTLLSNYGRGDGDTRTVVALGTRAFYGIGNRFVISDFSTPSAPTTLGSVTVGDRVEDVVVVGNTAYVASGAGVDIFNVQNPTLITPLGAVAALSYGEGIAVDPPYILMGDGSAGLRIIDATTPGSPSQVAQIDTLGYVEGVSYSGDMAYVAAGSRIHIIDYSTPASPTYAGRIDDPLDYYQGATARGSFLYVSDFFGGVRVFNISNPASPQDIGFFDPADRTARISLDGDFAFASNGDKGVTILDVSTPASPTQVAVIDTPGRALQTQVSGTLAFIADTQGLQVFDISTPSSPVFRGQIEVQSPADGKAFGISLAGDFAYVAYGDAGLRILNASNPASLAQVGQVDVKDGAGEGQARQVAVSGTTAYVASRSVGVRVVDISDPANPTITSTLAVEDAGDVAVDGTTLAVAGGTGITLFDISTPASPTQLFASDGLGYSDRVGVSGAYAYAITTGSTLRIFDISTPASISLVGEVETGGDYSEGRITVEGDRLYTTNGDLLVVDISNKTAPSVLGTYDTPSYSYSATASGMFAYAATERDGILLIDVSNPASPTEVGAADPGDEMRDVAVRREFVFAANGDGGVSVFRNALAVANEDGPGRTASLALLPTAPNPARNQTSVRFELAEAGQVTIEVFNVLGQRVASLLDEARPAGTHTVAFDTSALPSGTYVVQAGAQGEQATRRMVVVR